MRGWGWALLGALWACSPDLGQRCDERTECPRGERCDPPGWCVADEAEPPIDSQRPDRETDGGRADAEPPNEDADRPSIDGGPGDGAPVDVGPPPDRGPPDGCGDWVRSGANRCEPPAPTCDAVSTPLAQGCLADPLPCGEGQERAPDGQCALPTVECDPALVTAGPAPNGCIRRGPCPPQWDRIAEGCAPPALDCGVDETIIEGRCAELAGDCDFPDDARSLFVSALVSPDQAPNGSRARPYPTVAVALGHRPQVNTIVVVDDLHPEHLVLGRDGLRLRGDCDRRVRLSGTITITAQVNLYHLDVFTPAAHPFAILVAGEDAASIMDDVRILRGDQGGLVVRDGAQVGATRMLLQNLGGTALTVDGASVTLQTSRIRRNTDGPAVSASNGSELVISDLTASPTVGGVLVQNSTVDLANLHFHQFRAPAIQILGEDPGEPQPVRQIAIRVPLPAEQPRAAVEIAGVNLQLDDLSVRGLPAMRLVDGARVTGARWWLDESAPALHVTSSQLDASDLYVRGGAPLLHVDGASGEVAARDAVFVTDFDGPPDQAAVRVVAPARLGLTRVRVEGWLRAGIAAFGAAAHTLLEGDGVLLRQRGAGDASGPAISVEDGQMNLSAVRIEGASAPAVRLTRGILRVHGMTLRGVANNGDMTNSAVVVEHGTLEGGGLRVEALDGGAVMLRAQAPGAGGVDLSGVQLHGGAIGLANFGAEATLERATVHGGLAAAIVLGETALLRISDSRLTVDRDALVVVSVADEASLEGTRLELGGADIGLAHTVLADSARVSLIDTRLVSAGGAALAVRDGALFGRHVAVDTEELAGLLLAAVELDLDYLTTAAAAGLIAQPAEVSIPFWHHLGPPEQRLQHCDADCPPFPDAIRP